MRYRPGTGGFSTAELVVTLGVLSVVSAIAMPRMSEALRANRLNSVSRQVLGDLRRARGLAVSGRTIDEGPPALKIRAAGIRIDTPYRYSVFIDVDDDPENFNEVDVHTIELDKIDPQGTLQITKPAAGTRIRLDRRGGTRRTISVVIEDAGRGRSRQILLTSGGQARLE